MGFGNFWLQFNNGKKEQLSDIHSDIRRETINKKYQNIFDFFDSNKNGALDSTEVKVFEEILSKLTGDKILTEKEAETAFSKLGIKNINKSDFINFVKNLSDANKKIQNSYETTLPDGSRKVVTNYTNGSRLTAVYYPDGDLKYTITEVVSNGQNNSTDVKTINMGAEKGSRSIIDNTSQNIETFYRKAEFSPRAEKELRVTFGEHFQEVADNILGMIKPFEGDMTTWDRAGVDMRQAFIDAGFTELFTAEGVKRLETLRQQAEENSKLGRKMTDMAVNQPGAFDFHIEKDFGLKSHELEKIENFHQTATKYLNAKSLKQRIELLNKGLKEIKQLYANAQAKRRSGEYTELLESGSSDSYNQKYAQELHELETKYEEKCMEVLTAFFNGDKGVAEAFFNSMKVGLKYGTKEENENSNAMSVIIERIQKATEESLRETLTSETYDALESRYKAEFKELYGREDNTTEVENIIQTGQTIGGTIKIGAMTAITILVNALTMGSGNAALIAAMTNPLSQYLTTVGTDYALSVLGALSSLNELNSEKHEQILEGTKETAKFIGVGMLSAPLCKFVGQTLAKYTGKLFESGVKTTSGAVTATTVTGESVLKNICLKSADFAGSFGTELGVFTAYGVASQDEDLEEAFGSNRDMLTLLKVINKFLEVALGRFVRAQGVKGQQKLAQAQYEKILKESGLDNAKITKHETPTGVRFSGEIDGVKFTAESEPELQGKLLLIAAHKFGITEKTIEDAEGSTEITAPAPKSKAEKPTSEVLSIDGKKTYMTGNSRGIVLNESELVSALQQLGFSEKGIRDIQLRFKNDEGGYNKEILEFINEIKKTGVDELMAIHIARSKTFRFNQEENYVECKIPTTGQMNDIIDGIAYLKSKGADDNTIYKITDCIITEDGKINENILNNRSFETLYNFYNQIKDIVVVKNMSGAWLEKITNMFLTDNTGALNDTNIKFVKDILNKCPKNLSVLKYARDENGVCYSNTSEIIDYASAKSKELEPWQIGINIRFLRDKNGRLNTKNETKLNQAIERLKKEGIKHDKLEYLLDDNGILDFETLDSKIDELLGLYEIFGDKNVSFNKTTDRIYAKIESNSREAKLETLKTLAHMIKSNGLYANAVSDLLLRNKKTSITPEQIKTIDKIISQFGCKVYYILRACTKENYKDFDNLLEKLKLSKIPHDTQADILKNSNSLNIKIAERLCFDEKLDFSLEQIAKFLSVINETNIDFIKTILSNKDLYAKLKTGLNQIGEKLSYNDLLSNLEFQFMKSKSGEGSKISDNALTRNVQKLNDARISKSELFKFLEEDSSLTDKDVDAIANKIVKFHIYTQKSLISITDNIEGSSSFEKLNILLDILSIREFKTYELSPFFESLLSNKKPVSIEQLLLFKEITEHYKNEKSADMIFSNMLKNVIQSDSSKMVGEFYTQLKTSPIDNENQLTMMREISEDNVGIFSSMCFNNNLGFTAEEVLKVAKEVTKDNFPIVNEILEKCKEKQVDKKTYISIITGAYKKETWNLLKYPFIKQLFLDNVEVNPRVHTSLSSDNYVELITDKIHYNIKIDNDQTARMIGTEEGIRLGKKSTGLKITYEDGSSKQEQYWGIPGLIASDGTIEVVYDSEGRKVTRTLTKKSKKNPGVLVVLREIYDKDGNVTEVKELGKVKNYGSKDQGYKIEREFTSPNGTVLRHTVTGGPKGSSSAFEAAGRTFERRFRVVDDNTTESKAWDNKYTAKFGADKVEVTIEKADGSTETVTLDSNLLDPQLMPLFKQLPVDYLYVLAKTDTSVYLDKNVTKNAFFSPNRNSIGISKELANDPFTFAHEFGHMLDHNVFDNLNADKTLKEIFARELENYKMQSSRFNEVEIGYFVAKDHVNAEGCLTEVIAEANAIISGLKHDTNFILLRAKILQENFPETISYIGSKIKEAMNGEIKNNSNQNKTNTKTLEASPSNNINETEILDICIKEIEDIKTKKELDAYIDKINRENLPKRLFGYIKYKELDFELRSLVSNEQYNKIIQDCKRQDGSVNPRKLENVIKHIKIDPEIAELQKKLKELVPNQDEYNNLVLGYKTTRNYEQAINYITLKRVIIKIKREADIEQFWEKVDHTLLSMEQKQILRNMLDDTTYKFNLKKYIKDPGIWEKMCNGCMDAEGFVDTAKLDNKVTLYLFMQHIDNAKSKKDCALIREVIDNTAMTSETRLKLSTALHLKEDEVMDNIDDLNYHAADFDAIRTIALERIGFYDDRLMIGKPRATRATNAIFEQLKSYNRELVKHAPNIAAVGDSGIRGRNIVTLTQKLFNHARNLGLKCIIDLRDDTSDVKINIGDVEHYKFPISYDGNSDEIVLHNIAEFFEHMEDGNFYIGCTQGSHRTDIAIALNYVLNTTCTDIPEMLFLKRMDASPVIKRIYKKIINLTPDEQIQYGITEDFLQKLPKSEAELDKRIKNIRD